MNPDVSLTKEEWARAYRLLRYVDEPAGRSGRRKVEELKAESDSFRQSLTYHYKNRSKRRVVVVPLRRQMPMIVLDRCFVAGACTEADVFDRLTLDIHYITWNYREFSPQIREVAQRLVDRIIQIETQRGDMAGKASDLASNIRGLVHLPHVVQILKTGVILSRTGFSFSVDITSRAKSLTRLLTYSRPAPEETPEVAAMAINTANAAPERLIEFALVSPYWAGAIERILGWDGLEDAVWWLHGHTKDTAWGMPEELKELSAGAISERTPLTAEQLENGACDPAWFHRFRHKLDDKQWKLLDICAKFASSGMGHARAQLYAKALSGSITVREIVEIIQT
jgi:hypothetical protein